MRPVVVLSDLHFGQDQHNMVRGAEAFNMFFERMDALREAEGDPRFVMAGDIFDLWRAYAKDAIPLARPLFKGLADRVKNGSDITYIPGNHDHYVKMKIFGSVLNGRTNISSVEPGDSDTIRPLKALGVDFEVVYPDLELKVGRKRVTITHGHFLTEEIYIYDPLIRFYLFFLKALNLLGPSREILERRKTWLYERIFDRLVRTFSGSKEVRPFRKAPKPVLQKASDDSARKKMRNSWEIMNMRNRDWGMKCDVYLAGHTHTPGVHDPDARYPTPYVNSGMMRSNMATYCVIFKDRIETRNVTGERVCPDLLL